MKVRSIIRGILLLAVLVSTGLLVVAWQDADQRLVSDIEAQSQGPFDERSSVVAGRERPTVITTDPPGRTNETAEIVAFAPDGRLQYYNDTYGNYFDVDPDPSGSSSVLYTAGTRFDPCPSRLERRATTEIDDGCALVVVEHVNLSTATTTRLHTEITAGGIWHDVDRLGESRLVVADIEEDRVFVLDTTDGTREWVWDAERDFSRSTGGQTGDWTHLNDVEVLKEGRVMVSLRNQDQVIVLDRRNWLLENWTLGSDDSYDVLYEQHNPDFIPRVWGGPAILVADSENNRVVEYQRTADGWQQSWQWNDDELRWPRDADRLPNGHTLVTDSQGNRVLEIDQAGDVVWSVTIGTPYEAERLGTGDESASGRTARALGFSSITERAAQAPSDGASTPSGAISRTVAFLTGPVLNGILYVMPAWVTVGDLPVLGLLAGSVLVWGVVELHWSSFGHPIYRGK